MEEYSDARVTALVAREYRSNPEALIRTTLGDLSSFRGPQSKFDDLTIMALRRMAERV